MNDLQINDKTSIPLGLGITAIGLASAWLTSISWNVAVASARLTVVEQNQKQYLEHIQSIQTDLAVVKARVESINNKLGGSRNGYR